MIWLAGAVVVAALAVGGTSYVMRLDQESGVIASVPIGGPFELVNQDGEVVTEEDFAGRLMLVYFGYTFCPDVCPTALQTMSLALEQLGEDADDVAFVFITVDPERDTVEQMERYVSLFEPEPVGLTGSAEQVAAAARSYRVYYRVPESEDPDYAVDHSPFVYLMDRQGRYLTHFGHAATPEEMAERIEEALS